MYEYRAKVNRIIDGDSIVLDIDLGFDTWINNQSIRLFGIDTPECRTRDLDEKARGLLAKTRVEGLLPVGDIVYIKTIKDKNEKFGRILGEIINNDDININALLLEESLAAPYLGQSKEDIEKIHLENREILIEQGKFEPINED